MQHPTEAAFKAASELQQFLKERGGVDDNAVIASHFEAFAEARCKKLGDCLLRAYQHVSHGGPSRKEVETALKEAGLL